MSRKFILNLAIATLAAATLIAGSAGAMAKQSNGGHSGNNHAGNNHPGKNHSGKNHSGKNHPGKDHSGKHSGRHDHDRHHHRHVVNGRIVIGGIYERGYVQPVGYAVPVSAGPCTCLTKDYTPEGIVVFRDLCTKEMASAPLNGMPAQTGEVASPTNFAGKTYQDYQAANPQAQAAPQQN